MFSEVYLIKNFWFKLVIGIVKNVSCFERVIFKFFDPSQIFKADFEGGSAKVEHFPDLHSENSLVPSQSGVSGAMR